MVTEIEIEKWLKEKMNPLELSIRKWEDIVAGVGVDNSSDNCALCHVYLHNDCDGCPVAEVAAGGCIGTPYELYSNLALEVLTRGLPERKTQADIDKELLEYAKEEVEFLKSLRKKK